MKIRNILYGYQCLDGKIEFHPQESAVMKEVFKAYTEGKSLLEISKWLNERQIEYMQGVIGWNKSRIMRLLEDKRYLGNDKYPALIDQATYDTVQAMKEEKCDQKGLDRQADIFQINTPVKCPNCNGIMRRKVNNRLKTPVRWVCQNPECKRVIGKTDDNLIRELTEIINSLIENPEQITIPTEKEIEPSVELRRLNNEITRMFDSIPIDRDVLRKKMIEYASLKYAEVDTEVSVAQRLKDVFIETSPMNTFSLNLFERTVDEIRFYMDGTLGIILENHQEIRNGG